jgi:uncharacterized tellurite resistance protein B-like protein
MTPSEKNILKSLVAVAWADGKVAQPETGVLEGLLIGFDASDDEEREILEYAKSRRTFDDLPLSELSHDDRELLLANAALMTHADGEQTEVERELLYKLIALLELDERDAQSILKSARDGALVLGARAIEAV